MTKLLSKLGKGMLRQYIHLAIKLAVCIFSFCDAAMFQDVLIICIVVR